MPGTCPWPRAPGPPAASPALSPPLTLQIMLRPSHSQTAAEGWSLRICTAVLQQHDTSTDKSIICIALLALCKQQKRRKCTGAFKYKVLFRGAVPQVLTFECPPLRPHQLPQLLTRLCIAEQDFIQLRGSDDRDCCIC